MTGRPLKSTPLRLTHRSLAPALLALTAACSGGRDEGAHPAAARDSAGVAIVEHARVPEPLAALATLDSGALVIGALDGEPAYTFGRIADVASLPGGGVAVADSRAREVRVFDAEGRHTGTLGGTGEGPGEFTMLSALAGTAGDTVWAWDGRAQRLTAFLTDGTVVAEATREGPFTERISGLERLADGTYLASSDWRRGGPSPTGSVDWHVARDTVVFRHLNPRLELLDTVTVLPAREYLLTETIAAGPGTFSTSRAERARPFTRSLYFDSHDGQLVSGVSDSYVWERRSADGSLLQAVRAPGLDRPITPADASALKARYLAGSPDADAIDAIDAMFEDFPLPDILPAFEAIHVDAGGRVWLSRFRLHDEGPTVWVVFGGDGALLGEVSTPDGFTVHEIGEDYVLGVRLDRFDVSYAVRYPLRWKE